MKSARSARRRAKPRSRRRPRQGESERRWPAFARAYHERVIEPKRTEVHAREWISSLERHVPREIWHKPIDRIEAPELLDAVVKAGDPGSALVRDRLRIENVDGSRRTHESARGPRRARSKSS